ncbi:unnamed protein product [Adineta steineri]|uniref:Golgi SNAP receptor complex member 1 n=1 Tax=Adineta steineri TaxID=433720 RepID=A0A818VTZ1_9BILA|nr:unnamed protein product [Adineta steineri]CAF3716101.1 unnamed protein product [Adineta steineri]
MNRASNNNSYSSTNSRMLPATVTDWEDLRKQARQLENEIDVKLMSFSKLCSNYVARDQALHPSSSTSPSSFEAMSIEIDKLLEHLSDINKRMTDAIPALSGPNTAATHTLQRHHEICQDYRREFDRTKANIRNFQTREDLLINNNPSSDINTPGLSSRRQDYYLREMDHLTNSHKLIDGQLDSMKMLKDNLFDQRKYFMNITHKVKNLTNRFPLMNNILQKVKIKKRKDSLVLDMANEHHHHLLYKHASISLFESYIAIEKFIIDTRLSFIDQYKLFDLLKKLLPQEDNHLTCQGFLSWLVWRVDQHEEQQHYQHDRQINTNKRLLNDSMVSENVFANKRLRINHETYSEAEPYNDVSLVHYTQQQLENNINASSDIHQQIARLQSIVLRLASNIDTLNHQSDIHNSPPSFSESNIKHEHIDDTEPSELEIEEDQEEDETSDITQRLDLPASTSTNLTYTMHPIPTNTIIYNGRNMMKHLRRRTTLTSFARHVASDLFSRDEIMAKLHVDHNNERDIFLRHCICTAWNLTEQELYLMWPKIRNALLQLRRDAIAGKCIRMNSKRKQQQQQQIQQQQSSNHNECNSEDDDDDDVDNQIKSDLLFSYWFWILDKNKKNKINVFIMDFKRSKKRSTVTCESQATGRRIMRIHERIQDKLEFLHIDPWIDQ